MPNVELTDELSEIFPSFTNGRFVRQSDTSAEMWTGTIQSLSFRHYAPNSRRLVYTGPVLQYINESGKSDTWYGKLPLTVFPERCTAELQLDGALIIKGHGMTLTLLPRTHQSSSMKMWFEMDCAQEFSDH